MSKIRVGNKQNSYLNGEWAGHVRKDEKKHTSGKRRVMDKQVIKKDLKDEWSKVCQCENSIGQTWCCNLCGLPYDNSNATDGYHTFAELYEHRHSLFIALCKELINNPEYQSGQKSQIWRSKKHSDSTFFDGWFIMGIGKNKGEQITYHLPMSLWENTNFVETLELAPTFDNHTSNDVLKRIKLL